MFGLIRNIFIYGLLLFGGSYTARADIFPLSESLWQDETFIKRFLGSYGFDGAKDPKINAAEKKIFDQIKSYMQSNRLNEAASYLRASINSDSSAALDFVLGNVYYQLDDLQLAGESYNRAVNKFPGFARAHKNLGYVYVRDGQYKSAVQAFAAAIQAGSAESDVYGLLAYSYLSLGKYSSALEGYEEALLFAPDVRDWKLGKLQCLYAMEYYREVIAMTNEVLTDDANDSSLLLLQANAFLALEQPMQALVNVELVHRLGASNAQSLMLLGDIYLQQEVVQLAANAYKSAIRLQRLPSAQRAIYTASLLVQQGTWAEAEAYLQLLKETYQGKLSSKERTELLVVEAELSLGKGNADEAAKTLLKVVEAEPMHGQSLLLLGRYYSQKKEYEKAAFVLERAEKLPKFQWKALVALGQNLVAQWRYEDALIYLRKAYAIQERDHLARYIKSVDAALNRN